MIRSYRQMALEILKNRKKQAVRHHKDEVENIKAGFIRFALKGYFKNIIDLIIESHDLIVDPTDQEFILEELLKLEDVTIKKVLNVVKKWDTVITFKNVFGLTIQFVSNSGSNKIFYCNVSKDAKLLKHTATDIDSVTLATFVADYLQE